MVVNKYLAALLSIGIVVLTAFVAIPEGERNPATIGQLAILALGAIVTYLVPLLESRWAGALKTGAAVAAALIAAIIPFWAEGAITAIQVAVVALAALNALAVEVGVQVRKDDLRLMV